MIGYGMAASFDSCKLQGKGEDDCVAFSYHLDCGVVDKKMGIPRYDAMRCDASPPLYEK